MARKYARVLLTIWNDPDFKARSSDAQWLYFVLLTHPTMTSCGVVDWREPRLSGFTAGMTTERLRDAAWELGEANLIAVDPDTEEALVRSYVRHDGVLESPNMTKALVREHAAIASPLIGALVSQEVRRGLAEHPEWRGADVAGPIVKQFTDVDHTDVERVPTWFRSGSDSATQTLPTSIGEPFPSGSPIPYPSPSPSTSDEVEVSSTAVAVPDAAPAKSRGMRVPDPFPLTDEMKTWAAENTPGVDIEATTVEFIDYWRGVAGAKGVKLDWIATWRNRMRDQHKYLQRTRPGGRPSTDRQGQILRDELTRARAADAARANQQPTLEITR